MNSQPRTSSTKDMLGFFGDFVKYITRFTSGLRSLNTGKKNPSVGSRLMISSVFAFFTIVLLSLSNIRPSSLVFAGQIAATIKLYSSAELSSASSFLSLVIMLYEQ